MKQTLKLIVCVLSTAIWSGTAYSAPDLFAKVPPSDPAYIQIGRLQALGMPRRLPENKLNTRSLNRLEFTYEVLSLVDDLEHMTERLRVEGGSAQELPQDTAWRALGLNPMTVELVNEIANTINDLIYEFNEEISRIRDTEQQRQISPTELKSVVQAFRNEFASFLTMLEQKAVPTKNSRLLNSPGATQHSMSSNMANRDNPLIKHEPGDLLVSIALGEGQLSYNLEEETSEVSLPPLQAVVRGKSIRMHTLRTGEESTALSTQITIPINEGLQLSGKFAHLFQNFNIDGSTSPPDSALDLGVQYEPEERLLLNASYQFTGDKFNFTNLRHRSWEPNANSHGLATQATWQLPENWSLRADAEFYGSQAESSKSYRRFSLGVDRTIGPKTLFAFDIFRGQEYGLSPEIQLGASVGLHYQWGQRKDLFFLYNVIEHTGNDTLGPERYRDSFIGGQLRVSF